MKEFFYTIVIAIFFYCIFSPETLGKNFADLQKSFLNGYHAELEKK